MFRLPPEVHDWVDANGGPTFARLFVIDAYERFIAEQDRSQPKEDR